MARLRTITHAIIVMITMITSTTIAIAAVMMVVVVILSPQGLQQTTSACRRSKFFKDFTKAPESTFVCCMLSITMLPYCGQKLNLEAHAQTSSLRVFEGPFRKKPLRQRPLWCWLALPAARFRSRDDSLKQTEKPSKTVHPAENSGLEPPTTRARPCAARPWDGEILHNAKPINTA